MPQFFRWSPAVAAVLTALLGACGGAALVPSGQNREVAYETRVADSLADYVYGQYLLAQGKPAEAVPVFEASSTADPTALEPRLALGLAQRLADDPEGAIRTLVRAAELDVSRYRTARLLAQTYEATEDWDAMHAAWQSGDPGSEAPAEWYAAWWNATDRAGDPAQTLSAATAFTERHPDAPLAWRLLAITHANADDPASAATAYRHAASLPGSQARDAELAIAMALTAEDMPQAHEALRLCQQRFREHVECGALAVRLALRDAQLTADTLPADESAWPLALQTAIGQLAGISALERRSIARAAVALRPAPAALTRAWAFQVKRLRSRNVASVMAAAWAVWGVGLVDDAIVLMQHTLTVDPANFDALNFIGYDWAERGIRLDEAEVLLREAVRLRPDDPNIADSLAWALFRLGRFEEAVEIQAPVVERLPQNAVILDHWGDMLQAVGRNAEALDAYERALRNAGPSDEDVAETAPAKIEALRALLGLPATEEAAQ